MNIGHAFLWAFFILVFLCSWAASLASLFMYRRLRRKNLKAVRIMQEAAVVTDENRFFTLVVGLMEVLAGNYSFLQEKLAAVQKNDNQKECRDYFHFFFLCDMHDRRDRFKNALPAFIMGGFVLVVSITGMTYLLFRSDSFWEILKIMLFAGSIYLFGLVALLGLIHFHRIYKVFPSEMEKIDAKLNDEGVGSR